MKLLILALAVASVVVIGVLKIPSANAWWLQSSDLTKSTLVALFFVGVVVTLLEMARKRSKS